MIRERILSPALSADLRSEAEGSVDFPAPLRPMPVLRAPGRRNADDLALLDLEGDILERPEEGVVSFQFTSYQN